MINILEHFPIGDTPREEQTKILSGIQEGVRKGKKFIIIQAPTGCGKSHIAATIANSSRSPHPRIVQLAQEYKLADKDGNGYMYEDEVLSYDTYGAAVLTVSKALQNQYGELFTGSSVLKGKQNYVCAVDDAFDCDLAPCMLTPKLLGECIHLQRCPMLNARRSAWQNKFGVYNYSVFMNQPDFMKRRQYYICDEASELEDEIVKYYSCSIDYSLLNLSELKMEKLKTTINGDAYRWLMDLSLAIKEVVRDLETNILKNKKNKRMLTLNLSKYRYYKQLLERTTIVLQCWYKAEYIAEIDSKTCTFTPLYVNLLAQEFFQNADTVILLSGTIIDHHTYAETLGIKSGEYEYIEVNSAFEPTKSPIYCEASIKISHKNIDAVLPNIITKAMAICDHYKESKGIIHTHTFKITDEVIKKVRGDNRFLVRDRGVSNETILNEHYYRKDGTVLISPSLGFGTDLRDDFGRFSIIMKTPYLPLNSERVKRLAERNQRWYEMKALVNLVQMCGRTTRSADDYSDTFILDGAASDLIKRNLTKIPKYFLDRIH